VFLCTNTNYGTLASVLALAKSVLFDQLLILTAPQHMVGSKVMLIQTYITMVNMLHNEVAKYFVSSKAQC
jgi:hypothetical protein